jgi:hypothetical protein
MLSKWNGRPLNGAFGALIENANPKQLADPIFGAEAYQLWTTYNGLLIVEGPDLAFLTPQSLLRWGERFGTVDRNVESSRISAKLAIYRSYVPATPWIIEASQTLSFPMNAS